MNKRRILIQNFIFFIVSAIIYLISLSSIFIITRNEAINNLKSYSKQVSSELISTENADDVINEFSLIDNFRVSIYEDGVDTPIADTRAFPEMEGGFNVIQENVDSVYYTYSDTTKTDMIYYVTYDTDSSLYIRVGFPRSEGEKSAMYMLYFGISGFLILDIVFSIYSYLNFKKSIAPLKMATKRLQQIVGSESNENNPKDDLKGLSDSIDKVGIEFQKQLDETNESQQKLNFIINSLTQGILVIDGNNSLIMMNDTAANLFNIDKVKVLNKDFSLCNPDKKTAESVDKILKGSDYIHFDILIKERTYMIELNSINYQWSVGKNKQGCLVFIYDITSQKNADEIQREFFANASHELKSPLTSILGYQEMIKEGLISTKEELTDANDRTLKEAQRMKGIVKYMLENSNKLDVITISEHNVKKYVLSILDSLEYEIREKNLKIVTKLEDLTVKVNHDDLDKLIRNIITNAIKYNKQAGIITITINAKTKQLTIADTGIGIKQSEVDNIFERFYMVDKGRSRESDSSGIGLSIVKNIVEYYNLKIDVKSKVGEGSSFVITFK